MPIRSLVLLVAVGCTGVAVADDPPPVPPPATARVHDPCLIQDGPRFVLFATGRGVPIRTSGDLVQWERAGAVFSTLR